MATTVTMPNLVRDLLANIKPYEEIISQHNQSNMAKFNTDNLRLTDDPKELESTSAHFTHQTKQHSPAPWRIHVLPAGKDYAEILSALPDYADCGVAEVTHEADAALIAAAPEMLEMLKELARYDDEMYRVDSYYAMNAELRESLNELIAKAEGNVPAKTETE